MFLVVPMVTVTLMCELWPQWSLMQMKLVKSWVWPVTLSPAHPEPAHPVLVCWKGRNSSPRAVAPVPFPTKSPRLCLSLRSAQEGCPQPQLSYFPTESQPKWQTGALWTLTLMRVLPVASEGSRAGSQSSESPKFHNTITESAKENFPDSLETKFLPCLRWNAYQDLQAFLVNFSPVPGEFPAGGGVNVEEKAIL